MLETTINDWMEMLEDKKPVGVVYLDMQISKRDSIRSLTKAANKAERLWYT